MANLSQNDTFLSSLSPEGLLVMSRCNGLTKAIDPRVRVSAAREKSETASDDELLDGLFGKGDEQGGGLYEDSEGNTKNELRETSQQEEEERRDSEEERKRRTEEREERRRGQKGKG